MKKLLTIASLILIWFALCDIGNAQKSPAPEDKTQVVIIGTIHAKHFKNPNYTPDILKGIILSLKPDAILNELPLSKVDPNGRPLEKIRRKDNPGGPECWAADTAATELQIRQIPFDRPDRQKNFRKTNYFERQRRSIALSKKWANQVETDEPNSMDLKIAKLLGHIAGAEYHLFKNAEPRIINSEAHDSIIRTKKSLWYDILPSIVEKYPGYQILADDYRFAKDQWNQRNRIMADNIIKAAKEFPGKRLVVNTGATHRYILRDLLKDESGIDLKEYWAIIDFDLDKCLKYLLPPTIPEILHITPRNNWNKALDYGEYRSKSLDTVGYIHCSKYSQIIAVANHLFKGQKGLVLLVIDSKKVKPEIKWEGEEQANLFPHIYGPLNLDAVKRVSDFPPSEDGTFELPEGIEEVE